MYNAFRIAALSTTDLCWRLLAVACLFCLLCVCTCVVPVRTGLLVMMLVEYVLGMHRTTASLHAHIMCICPHSVAYAACACASLAGALSILLTTVLMQEVHIPVVSTQV
jgi:hypothetical protein